MRQSNCATDRKIPGLNALVDSSVGFAILFIYFAMAGRNTTYAYTHVGYTQHKQAND